MLNRPDHDYILNNRSKNNLIKLVQYGIGAIALVALINELAIAQDHSSKINDSNPIFRSKIVTSGTTGHQVKIDVDITGAKELYLVANDADDGFGYDWCDWAEPTLHGDDQSLPLTDLVWKHADSGWGTVHLNTNCDGGPIRINDKEFKTGIGTHANSVIHFQLPKNHNFKKLTAIAGIDQGGTRQLVDGVNKSSVRFLVFTERPPSEYWSDRKSISPADHESGIAVDQFEVHPELAVSLFAAEPMLANPSNIDVDHLGRVWVCEVLNYRGGRNNREKGDRILVLEDSDGNGQADKQTVFYQGRDIDSVHGICVLGDRALVSAGSEVFFLIDTDGDLKADKKEVLFTGIAGVQHDHGIHAFVFGPDGKLYFNFGNAGERILDKNAEPIVDVAGQTVEIGQAPYREGMVFRCNLDGSQFETLGWNFRNNWEVCVDSFGRMWQSDNDDDGNRATRINFVMPFGNYGFKDEFTGAGWRQTRIGMADSIPERHWHVNDPGVVPNLLITGAGSPTGICVYEGDALPELFRNQMIHCDAGPNVVRAYPIQKSGAGFTASAVSLIDGSKHNQWYRPSDVCVAPDGSLMVADWYDPGVGGHAMGDTQRGRIFRIVAENADVGYSIPKPDFDTIEGSIQSLCSPNQATRFIAFQSLVQRKTDAVPRLAFLANDRNPRFRARAIWALSKIAPESTEFQKAIQLASQNGDPEVRAMAIRVIRQTDNKIDLSHVDESPSVNRELLISLSPRQIHKIDSDKAIAIWTELARRYQPGDRWYLEALGIAAEKKWDECIASLNDIRSEIDPHAWSDIIWRSRGRKTADLLAELVMDPGQKAGDVLRYLRALEMRPTSESRAVFKLLADKFAVKGDPKSKLVFVEAIQRLQKQDLSKEVMSHLNRLLDSDEVDLSTRARLVEQFALLDRKEQLANQALQHQTNQVAIDAMATVLRLDRDHQFFNELLSESEQTRYDEVIGLVRKTRTSESRELLKRLVFDDSLSVERRKLAILALSNSRPGLQTLCKWVESGEYEAQLEPALSAVLNLSEWPEINEVGRKHFPLSLNSDSRPLPRIVDLLRMPGNPQKGSEVYLKDKMCSKCHMINDQGVAVGPDLSEIGKKLSRQAMFESILFPSAGIGHEYQNWSVLTIDGEMFTGIIINETESALSIQDAKGVIREIANTDIEEKKLQKLSLMPEEMHKDVTNQELVDLVAYLLTLKDAKTKPGSSANPR